MAATDDHRIQPFIGDGPGQVRAWPAGGRILHLYAVPDMADPANAAWASLARHARHAVQSLAPRLMAPVLSPWLHMTLARIPGAAAPDAHAWEPIASALSRRCQPLEPATVLMRACLTPVSALLVPAARDEGLRRLFTAVTDTLSETLGPDGWTSPGAESAHISAGYARAHGTAPGLARHLGELGTAPLRISSIAVVSAAQETATPAYTWDILANVRLADGAAPTSETDGRPSPDEIEAARTPAGGWPREQLAVWGVAWPPPKGWKQRLINEWNATQQGTTADRPHPPV